METSDRAAGSDVDRRGLPRGGEGRGKGLDADRVGARTPRICTLATERRATDVAEPRVTWFHAPEICGPAGPGL